MSLSNSAIVNQLQIFYPVQPVVDLTKAQVTTPGNNITDAGSLVRAAVDGDREAQAKLGAGEGGPDFVCTGTSGGAETDTFDIPLASIMKLYATQTSGVTTFVVRAKVYARSAAVATSGYWEVICAFQDIAGTMTAVTTTVTIAAVEGAATTDPTLTINSTNLRVSVTSLAIAALRAEVFVTQIQ